MLKRLRNRALGPGEKAVAVVAALVVIAGLLYGISRLLPEECGAGLERAGDECVGVTAGEVEGDQGTESLIEAVAQENDRVESDWTEPDEGRPRVPYLRIALMMPFTSDDTSTMTTDQIIRALAGAHAAQLRANKHAGPQYQLLLAPYGRNLEHWEPVVGRLGDLIDDEFPLVGVLGLPSSVEATQHAADALSERQIPVVAPVLTSVDMKSDYLFKISPSNASFARSLQAYLAEHPGKGRGFLVADDRDGDNYSRNLREQFRKHFDAYDLDQRAGYYTGTIGPDEGIPVRFSAIAQSICLIGADTIFFAGRDRDLPHLISQLADEPACIEADPMRVLKVGIGTDPAHTSAEIKERLERGDITLVNASSVAPGWWAADAEQPPVGLAGFLGQFAELEEPHELGGKALDDGYAIMHHDAFTVLSEASGQAFDEGNDSGAGDHEELTLPKHHDIYGTLINMGILDPEEGAGCISCVRGASGTFGFDNTADTAKWAICKPVPVVVYPDSTASDVPRQSGTTYRSYEESVTCP